MNDHTAVAVRHIRYPLESFVVDFINHSIFGSALKNIFNGCGLNLHFVASYHSIQVVDLCLFNSRVLTV